MMFQISINLQRPANSVLWVLKKTEKKWQGGLGAKQRMTGRREGVKQEFDSFLCTQIGPEAQLRVLPTAGTENER